MPNCRLTLVQAIEILLATGTANNIAKDFDVSHQTVRLYKNLQTSLAKEAIRWLDSRDLKLVPLDSAGSHKFSRIDILNIRADTISTSKAIAEHYGCSASMIRMIKTGKAYA